MELHSHKALPFLPLFFRCLLVEQMKHCLGGGDLGQSLPILQKSRHDLALVKSRVPSRYLLELVYESGVKDVSVCWHGLQSLIELKRLDQVLPAALVNLVLSQI